MSKDTKFIVGAVAAVLLLGYVVRKMGAAKATAAGGATEIVPQGNAWGWRYFSDGTAISPDGTYYKNGQMIYNATM